MHVQAPEAMGGKLGMLVSGKTLPCENVVHARFHVSGKHVRRQTAKIAAEITQKKQCKMFQTVNSEQGFLRKPVLNAMCGWSFQDNLRQSYCRRTVC
jgi:hypothetical protein